MAGAFLLDFRQKLEDLEHSLATRKTELKDTTDLLNETKSKLLDAENNLVSTNKLLEEANKAKEDAAKEINDLKSKISELEDQVQKANSEVRQQSAAGELPNPHKGKWRNNKQQTAKIVGEMADSGMNAKAIETQLILKGWTPQEAKEIMEMAGIEPGGQGQAVQYLQTATNPDTGQRVGLTEDGRWVPIQ